MNESLAINLSDINAICPQFPPNTLDSLLTLIANVGCVLNVILSWRFFIQRARFLCCLAFFDIFICICCIYTFSTAKLPLRLESESVAHFHTFREIFMKLMLAFYESTMSLILLCIIVERYLWTFSSRSRKILLNDIVKLSLRLGAAVYVLTSIITYIPGVDCSKLRDVIFRPIDFDNPSFHCQQIYIFPLISVLPKIATFVFAVLTVLRLPRIGIVQKPLDLDGTNLAEHGEEAPSRNTFQIKRSIICMLVIYVTFLIRTIAYYAYIDPLTSNFFKKSMDSRVSINWWYQVLSLAFSGSRYFVYYFICRNQIIVEYPLNCFSY